MAAKKAADALRKKKAKEKAEKVAEQIRKQSISDAEMMMNQFKDLELPDLPDIPMEDRIAHASAVGLYWGYNAVVAGMVAIAAKKAIDSLGANITRPDDIPDDWIESPSNTGAVKKWNDPNNPKGNETRVELGGKNKENPGGYRKNRRNGQYKNKDGNTVRGKSPDAHIPYP